MLPLVLRQNQNLKYLPLSFNNSIEAACAYFAKSMDSKEVVQVQEVKGKLFFVSRKVNFNEIRVLFGAQKELLVDILKFLSDEVDVYEKYEFLTSFKYEYQVIKELAKSSAPSLLKEHIEFINSDLLPIIEIHLNMVDEILKIKNHKSYVRKSLAEKGNVTLSKALKPETLQGILSFLKSKCVDVLEFNGLKNELTGASPSQFDYYKLHNVEADRFILFFKIVRAKSFLDEITKADLAKWLFRKFRYLKGGEYIVVNRERTITDKLKGNLTNHEMVLSLDESFH